MKNVRLEWHGDAVIGAVLNDTVAPAMAEIGLRVEGASKEELVKGHGVLTGTLRRSIHVALPGYAWRSDNVVPSTSTPERGGKRVAGVVIEVGSGLWYALAVHQGHHGFAGYHYIVNGVERVMPLVPEILARYAHG